MSSMERVPLNQGGPFPYLLGINFYKLGLAI